VKHSIWNQAKRDGKISHFDTGPIEHSIRGDYFDGKTNLSDGQSYLDKAVDVIATALSETQSKTAV
jgi:hypothetical protein